MPVPTDCACACSFFDHFRILDEVRQPVFVLNVEFVAGRDHLHFIHGDVVRRDERLFSETLQLFRIGVEQCPRTHGQPYVVRATDGRRAEVNTFAFLVGSTDDETIRMRTVERDFQILSHEGTL
ncbi:MAG: hypothetical protein [Podoviridae sp. ctda_1]|nr:MAG: hypothetical protein [Podoviridae sp. ctda_1]